MSAYHFSITQQNRRQAISAGGQGRGGGGWVPVLGNVVDGVRVVARIVNWIDGAGIKPAVGLYIGPNGYVQSIAEAVDIRGPMGDITPEMQTLLIAGREAAEAAESFRDETEDLKNSELQLHGQMVQIAQDTAQIAADIEADRQAVEISKNSAAASSTAAGLAHGGALTQANRAEQERIAAQLATAQAQDHKLGAQAAQSAVEAAGVNPPIRLNPNVVAADFTIPTGYNALSVGPIRIADGVTVRGSLHSTWSIV